jgi:hypothetical protein
MLPERYANLTHEVPYQYELGGGALSYLGIHHSYDTQDPQFALIKTALREQRPDLVFVEGVQTLTGPAELERIVRELDEGELIQKGGEAVYTISQALRRGTPWACPEPEDTALYRHLLQNFYSQEQIAAWQVLRLLPQYHRRGATGSFAGYVAPFIAQFKQATNWSSFDYSFAAAWRTVEHSLGEISIQNRERAEELTDPIPWPGRWEQQTIFNDMSRAALMLRDRAITSSILNELSHGKRLLVVYGAGHAVMQEPVYRCYFN